MSLLDLHNIFIVILILANKKSLYNRDSLQINYKIGETNFANDSLNLTDSGLLAYDSLAQLF